MKATILILSLFLSFNVQAAVSTKTITETNTSKTTITPEKKDIDEEITNARLRATTGAKKTLSFQSAFTYSGGSIRNPFGQERPKLSPGIVGYAPVKLSGSISGKYRMTERDNLNIGVGVGWVKPTYSGQKGQVENPYVSYGRLFKLGTVQNVTNASIMKYSASEDTNSGLNFEAGISHTFLTSVGASKLQLGTVLSFYREIYNNAAEGISNSAAVYPFGEYNLSDKLSIRTVYRGFEYFNSTNNPTTYVRNTATQSFGVGVSITRDIYLYPNVQWVWADMRPEKTNVALTANVSM